MLQPREADLPALLLFLVVLPLVTYILLGIWSEATKKKARISVIAQRAVEDTYRVEAMASANVVPTAVSPGTGFHGCARCFAPATTRCSRCKSVRYCSGKCQIIHWRQGHKQECHQWNDPLKFSAYPAFQETIPEKALVDNLKFTFDGYCTEEPIYHNLVPEQSNDSMMVHISELGRKSSGKPKSKRFESTIDDSGLTFDENSSHIANIQSPSCTLFTEMSSEDVSLGYKSGTGNLKSPDKIHSDQDYCPSSTKSFSNQTHKSTGDIGNGMKQSRSSTTSTLPDLETYMLKESENIVNITLTESEMHQIGFSSNNETANIGHSANLVKEGIAYKKPPYTVGHATSFPQKLRENIYRENHCEATEQSMYKENESRVPQMNLSTNSCLQQQKENLNIERKLAGSRKTSKLLKQNLVGLINDNKKNKLSQMLFPYEDLVKFFQCEVLEISPRGLINCGNSCYANAVLQCLACTKPLMVYLLRGLHSGTCLAKNWCLMCELEHYVSMLREGGGPLSPSRILSNMRNIGCRMGGGNQEDAHEFLRLLVTSMQSVCLEGLGSEKEVHPSLQETTLIQQIFGGRLKSKVKCLKCHLESERYESIMDLTVEIHGWVESLEDALTQFTAPEDLDGENMYRCGRCSAYVKARKQLSLHEVPNILTIVLKRFQTGKYGKINKCVTFPDMLDMIPFVTGTADSPPLYLLYAVVVHLDTLNASFSGHYISYVKDLQGTWFRIDDSEVQAVPPSQVMSEGAYMLFYSRSFPRPPRAYLRKVPSEIPVHTNRSMPKAQIPLKHEQRPEASYGVESSLNLGNDLRAKYEHIDDHQAPGYILRVSNGNIVSSDGPYSDSLNVDFSDATSSDWSLFTSSDESSFTESTRNSFSTVDYGDNASLDVLSSIFSSPFYVPEYSQRNTISCTKFSPSRLQTRFFSGSTDHVLDPSVPTQPLGNVHRGRNLARLLASVAEPSSNCTSYGR